jgi:hypothetical protein
MYAARSDAGRFFLLRNWNSAPRINAEQHLKNGQLPLTTRSSHTRYQEAAIRVAPKHYSLSHVSPINLKGEDSTFQLLP